MELYLQKLQTLMTFLSNLTQEAGGVVIARGVLWLASKGGGGGERYFFIKPM